MTPTEIIRAADQALRDGVVTLSQGNLFGGSTGIGSQGSLFGQPSSASNAKAGETAGHWVTIHGTHVLIKHGQSVGEALRDRFRGTDKPVAHEQVSDAARQVRMQGGKPHVHPDDAPPTPAAPAPTTDRNAGVVDPNRQLGMFAKDGDGNAIEVGEKPGQASLFGNTAKPPEPAKPKDEDAAARKKFDEAATPSMFGGEQKPAAAPKSPRVVQTIGRTGIHSQDKTRNIGEFVKVHDDVDSAIKDLSGGLNLNKDHVRKKLLAGEPFHVIGHTYQLEGAPGAAKVPDPAAKPAAPAGSPQAIARAAVDRLRNTAPIVQDFGEHIPGARKETAVPTGPRPKTAPKPVDDTPTWRKRYVVGQKLGGKFDILDKTTGEQVRHPGTYRARDYDTQEEAEQALTAHEVDRVLRVSSGRVHSDGSIDYGVYRKNSAGNLAPIKRGFKTAAEAQAHLDANKAELLAWKFEAPKRPYLDRVERTGKHTRAGHVKPSDFQDAFAFRGGQFGNWQTNADGQTSLNHAYDSLHDLADVIGLTPRQLSLDGKLTIAFGARGTGGKDSAAAHYEPDSKVINLTKMNGAGSLAHEFWHALDNHVGNKFEGGEGNFASENHTGIRGNYKTKLHPELNDAFQELHNVIHHRTEIVPRDIEKAKARIEKSKKDVEYNLNDIESTHKMLVGWAKDGRKGIAKARPFTPDEQAKWDELKGKLLAGDIGEAKYINGKPAPGRKVSYTGRHTTDHIEQMNDLHKAAAGRAFHNNADHSRGGYLYSALLHHERNIKDLAGAEAGEQDTRRITTDFKRTADELDHNFTKPYFATFKELTARAFESYVEDKITAASNKSQYLVHGTQGNSPWNVHMPKGRERELINGAFDKVMGAIRKHGFGDAPAVTSSTPADRVPEHLQSGRTTLSAGRDAIIARIKVGNAAGYQGTDGAEIFLSASTAGVTYLSACCGIRGAVTVGQGLPAKINGLPMHYRWCDAAYVDEWSHPKTGRAVPITTKRIDGWVDKIKLSRKRGVNLPVCKDHNETADNSVGEIFDARRTGNRLDLLLGFKGDDALKIGQRNYLSIGIDGNFRDSRKNSYGEAIRHVAVTPVPVIHGQVGFLDG